jgi:hypothetical protein
MLHSTIYGFTAPLLRSKALLTSLLLGLILFFTTKTNAQAALETSRTVSFNLANISKQLQKAPAESLTESVAAPFTFSLPQPNGTERLFLVYDSPIMDEDFQRQQPTFKTYKIVAADNPSVSGRMMVSPFGLNAIILSENGMVGIRPKDIKNPVLHEVYLGDGNSTIAGQNTPVSTCGFNSAKDPQKHVHTDAPRPEGILAVTNGATRRTYRLAIVATGEFGAANGGTVAAAQAVVTASVNAVQAIYDRELAVRFTLLTPFIYLDAATDPFNPAVTSNGNSLTNQAAEGVHMNFAVGTYDIGHVVYTNPGSGGAGVAGLGVVCDNGTIYAEGDNDMLSGHSKAAGWSGSNPNTSNGWYKLFTHEIGHMFYMDHTFNGDGDNCATGNHSLRTAYEIASGNTIMSYNGICGAAYNIPSGGVADLYFHANSLDSATAYLARNTCAATAATGNTPPTVNANPCGSTYRIPIGTPFTITGSATDANGDQIYYCWEQNDEDGVTVRPTHGMIGATAAANASAPLFRSYPPTTSPSRTIPAMNLVAANNYVYDYEPLPSVARTLNFRLTARDWNSNGGGYSIGNLAVTVTGTAFSVTAPNGGESIAAGNATTVTWNVGGGTYSPNVSIQLSIDGGLTYPYTLLASTTNDGSESVTIPSNVAATTTARIKVEGADGDNTCVKFFDISNTNFSITNAACAAVSNNLCSTSAVTLQAGNAGLNLGLTGAFSGVLTSKTLNITAADPQVACGVATAQGGTTCVEYTNYPHKSFDIVVGTTGSYTFTTTAPVVNMVSGFTVTSVFTSAGFSAPCTGFLGSNAYTTGGGGASSNGSFSLNLTACTQYKIMVFAGDNTAYGNNVVAISGAGTVYEVGTAPSGSYAYTYVAVSNADNQIKVVNASSNFTSLAAGSYTVYGAYYNTSATPSSWVGQTLSQVSGSNCMLFSANSKPVTVTSTLPVELLSFSGKWANNQSNLTWQTTSETHNRGFDIERSLTGSNFEKIGFVKSQGNSNTLQTYNFTDGNFNAPPQYIYYRLRQIDNDGKETYSKTIVLTPTSKGKRLRVYPNPVSNTLIVENTEGGNFQIINLLGQQVLSSKTPASGAVGLDVSTLPQGTYFIKVGTEQAKFIKQ